MSDAQESTFLDLLYSAAVDPSLWPTAIERLADCVGGSGAWLSRLSVADGSGVGVTSRLDPQYQGLYDRYYGALNPFSTTPDPHAYMATWQPKVVTDADWLTQGELHRTEYFNDFMRPQDIGSFMIIRLWARDLEVCALTVNRPRSKVRFSRDHLDFGERLRPHIRRAFDLTERLSDIGFLSPAADAALDQSPHAVFILNGGGRVRRTNRAADQLLARQMGLRLVEGRLRATSAAVARRLEALIGAATTSDPSLRTGGSMALRVLGKRSPLSVTVAPVQAERSPVFGHAPSAIVTISDPDAQAELTVAQLRALFGFTPAEARVAMTLLGGATTRQAAERLGVSFHTVRHQIQSMLEKTGAARQADLLTLLTRASR